MATSTDPVIFNPLAEGFADSPYEQYTALRDDDPVQFSDLLQGWVVTRFDDVSALLRDPTVSSDINNATPTALTINEQERIEENGRGARTLVLLDDPDHGRLRKLMADPFRAKGIEGLRSSIEAKVARKLDDMLEAHGPSGAEIDLVEEFAYPLPVEVFCDMLGVPDEDHPKFRYWTQCVIRAIDPVMSDEEREQCEAGTDEMYEYLEAQVDAKRADPGDDMMSALIHAEVDGECMSQQDLLAQLITLYMAGHEPTAGLIGAGMLALMQAPDQLDLMRNKPDLLRNGVSELLRYDGPNQFVRRILTEPTTLSGHELPAGAVIYASPASGNRDPRRWGDTAAQVMVDREDAGQHLQFGGGAHSCLGSHLARLQAEIALSALFDRLSDLELNGDPEWSMRMFIRGINRLPLRCSIKS